MGISSDGILFYGILIPEDDESVYDEDDERLGPIIEELRTAGFDLGIHCSYDYPMYYLAPSSLVVRASRGYPKDVRDFHEVAFEARSAGINQMLKRQADKYGFPWSEPRTYLASVMG